MSLTAYVTTRKIGGSLAVTIPKQVAALLGLHENEVVKIAIEKKRPDLFGKCKGIGRFSEEDRMDSRV